MDELKVLVITDPMVSVPIEVYEAIEQLNLIKERKILAKRFDEAFGIPKKYLGSSSSCHATKTQKRF